jgi:hypothetical protein
VSEDDRQRRLGASFITVVAGTWRYYRGAFGPLIRTFFAVTLLIYSANLILLTDISSGTKDTLIYVLQGLLPPFAFSLAFGVAAVILHREDLDDPVYARTAFREQIRPNLRAMISIALIASAASVLVAQVAGLLLFAVLYGPPILAQAAAIDGLGMQPAWQRTKELLAGAWGRVILHLITVMLGLSILANVTVGAALAIASESSDGVRTAVYATTLGIFLILSMPFLASAQYVLYAEKVEDEGSDASGRTG